METSGRFSHIHKVINKIPPGVRKWTYRILDGLASLGVLSSALSLFAFVTWDEIDLANINSNLFVMMYRTRMYWALFVYYLIQAIPTKDKSRSRCFQQLFNAGIFLICAILMQTATSNDLAVYITLSLHYLTFILDRVIEIVRKRKKRDIIFNASVILIFLLCLCFGFNNIYFIIPAFVILQMLIHIATISFSRIRFEVINKIIKKTYAAEILSGMLLLILAFSLVLPMYEPGMRKYSDALWYCFAIVTTIGFGDYTAITPTGRILSVLLGFYGIIIVALVTSIIVNFYNETKNAHDDAEVEVEVEKKKEVEEEKQEKQKE